MPRSLDPEDTQKSPNLRVRPGVLHSAHTASAAPLTEFKGVPFSVWERSLRSARVSLTASPAWLTRVLTDWESAHQLAG